MLTQLLRLRKVLIGKDFYQQRDVRLPRLTFGDPHADWTIYSEGLTGDSIVYSLGIGQNISFDLALIEHLGMTVHAFDPTPHTWQWLQAQSLPAQFKAYPCAIADYDGTALFAAPGIPGLGSHTLLQDVYQGNTMEVPVKQLSTIMQELAHPRIDLLKMDIEGAEYAVINNMIQQQLPVRQLLIEFHHRFPKIGIQQTKSAIRQLRSAGYRIFHVSATGEEFSFIRL